MTEPSRFLLLHAHGGGFFAQTCKSSEFFLIDFAVAIDIPILSIDYKLSAFPRGLEDVFYAYCWALKHPEKLGWTGEQVVFMGDSAGALILTSCIVKCIELNIKLPNFVVLIQGFFNMQPCVSPARFYACFDQILPDGAIYYIGNFYLTNRKHCRDDNIRNKCVDLEQTRYLNSTYKTPESILKHFPKTLIVSSDFDVGLDDSVELGKKMRRAGVDVDLMIFRDIPHALLNFSQVRKMLYFERLKRQ